MSKRVSCTDFGSLTNSIRADAQEFSDVHIFLSAPRNVSLNLYTLLRQKMRTAIFDTRFTNEDKTYFALSEDRQTITALKDTPQENEFIFTFTESDFTRVVHSVTFQFEMIQNVGDDDNEAWTAIGAAIPELVAPGWRYSSADHGAYLFGSNLYFVVHNAKEVSKGFHYTDKDVITVTYNAVERTLLFEKTKNEEHFSLLMNNVEPTARPCILITKRNTIVRIKIKSVLQWSRNGKI
jgi:uncharacterized pyridoxamine 5'-phosphate oxidase family protein